jgi:iron complex transport system ATP-binding protein
MSSRLEIDDVRWTAGGREILRGVTVDVAGGELVVILGLNGAGKSTLLNIVAGLRQAHGGTIRLNGLPAQDIGSRDRARLVAHLPQTVRADLPFLAEELVLMGRYPHTDRWFESDLDRAAVEQAMRRTDCWELRHRLVTTLSGGERQRVLLAACLAQSADVLLLDEPSTHLDIDQQLQCFGVLREEVERGVAAVAVTHDLNLALRFATRIIVLAEGRVAVDLPVAAAAESPAWLELFSSRLVLSSSPTGQPWISYS